MDLKDILQQLRTGNLNPDVAKQELLKLKKSDAKDNLPLSNTVSRQMKNSETENNCSDSSLTYKSTATSLEQQSVVEVSQIDSGIILVKMQDKAHKNAFSTELDNELTKVFEEIQENPKNKVVILTGYDNYFSSGGTKERLLEIQEGKTKYTDTSVFKLALQCKLPVVAAMQGHAFGAGWCLGMFCDFIVMSKESIYSANFMGFGFTPGAGSTLIFPEKLGNYLAHEILYSAKKYSGEELKNKGVPFSVVPQKEVLPKAIESARLLAESNREALIVLKEHFTEDIKNRLVNVIQKELKMHEKTFLNKESVKQRIHSIYGQMKKSKQEEVYIDNNNILDSKSKKKVSKNNEDAIAIIGMDGRFPKARNIEEFWNNLSEGKDCISEVPASRWSVNEYFDENPKTFGKTYSKWMGVLEDEDKFDPLFFNISPAEAELMDPQQRLFLESCWHCIEDAGIAPQDLSGSRCGVFVGCVTGDYAQLTGEDGMNAFGLMGGSTSILAGRVSYLLNLKGPCLSIDTACSASLVAITEACNSLILGTSDLALAGGVVIMAGASMHILSSKAGMLSPNGKCYTFDNRANGFVPGEGGGVILLKRLSDAIRDNDNIQGVIRGWGVNQDGKTNGITAPSTSSQTNLLKEVYQQFNINPQTITMVEAHGTGTKLGDPIEVEALTNAFGTYTSKKSYCALGSVKSNIGHLFAGAGIAGVIKVLLSLKNKMIPPTINYEKLNEHIPIDKTPFYINTDLQPWIINNDQVRRASVSSFGFSGTNSHIVIEEFNKETRSNDKKEVSKDNPVLFVLSAKTEERLSAYAHIMKAFIEKNLEINIYNLVYTLQIGREVMDYTMAIKVTSIKDLLNKLDGFVNNNKSTDVILGNRKSRVIFDAKETENLKKQLLSDSIAKRVEAATLLWINKKKFDWNLLYVGEIPNRISLPVYPFERESYWKAVSVKKNINESNENTSEVSINEINILAKQSSIEIEGNIKKIVSKILRIDENKIISDYELTRYGFDSISGMTLIDQLKKQYNLELSPMIVFEYNSLSKLTNYIISQIEHKDLSYPLSVSQTGLWLINQLSPNSYAYNLPSAFTIRNNINIDTLKASFKEIVARHPVLSGRIGVKKFEPIHIIDSTDNLYFEHEEHYGLSEKDLKAILLSKAQQIFDLENGTLMKVHVLSSSREKHMLLINIHHIVFDGSSLPVLLKELVSIYSSYSKGEEVNLPKASNTYGDFVNWQRNMLNSESGRIDKEYWMKKLEGELPVLDLPMSKTYTENTKFMAKSYMNYMPKELTEEILSISTREKVSPFVLMLSAFKTLLYRYTSEEDVVIGTATQGRPNYDFEQTIGYFTNMLLIRTKINNQWTFKELLKDVQESTSDALKHGNYPFTEIVKHKKGKQNRGDKPLIQIAFIFQNWLKNTDELFVAKDSNSHKLLSLEPIPEVHQVGEFDLSFEIIKDEDRYHLLFKYNPHVFDSNVIEIMCKHYIELIKSIALDTTSKICNIDFLYEEEKRTLLKNWIDTNKEYPSNKCIHQLFEEQVNSNPEDVAVIFEDKSMTYNELNKKANQVARCLRGKGLERDSIVAVIMERCLDMPVGLYGILKAGGAYMPIDPTYPKERIEYMLKNSNTKLLLVEKEVKLDIKFDGDIISIQSDNVLSKEDTNLKCINNPTDLAYVIYTSGSTGNPKGAMIEHHSLINRLKWMQSAYSLTKNDVILQKTPYTFDVSVWELFWWSIEGAKVCFLTPNAEKHPDSIVEAIVKNKATVLHFVPSMLNSFLEHIKSKIDLEKLISLKQVFASGEALTVSQVKEFNNILYRNNGTKLMNLYGPTEATIDVSYFDCTTKVDYNKIPIGRPIQNTQLYIVSKNNKLQPVGVPGELCIAGVQLARGYLNNDKLTKEKFVDNPFEIDSKMYKTGDLAKWSNDGNIDYLGRIDRQVKIRGFRIELGEIEARLLEHKFIKEACVVIDKQKDMTGNDRLKAFVVLECNTKLEEGNIRNYLKDTLPEYMIPSVFVEKNEMPLTAHGKADTKALLRDDTINTVSKVINEDVKEVKSPQASEIEEVVKKIYKEMLQLEHIDSKANFFDLGGHSLLLVKIAIRLKEELNREITTVDLFQYTTIEALCTYLSQSEKEEDSKKDMFAKSKRKGKRQRKALMQFN